MSSVPYALTTTAKVKAYLGITVTDYDALFDSLVSQMTDFIEGLCGGRRFLSTTYTREIYDSKRGRNVFLNNRPVTSLILVEYRAGTPSAPVWNTYAADGYLLYGKSGFVKFYAMLPEISQGLAFTYVAGYLIDFNNELDPTKHTLPFDLTQLCNELAAKRYNTRNADGIERMSTEGQSVQFESKDALVAGLSSFQRSVLAKYQGTQAGI